MTKVDYHPLGNERRKAFIGAAQKAAGHFYELGEHVATLESPRGIDMQDLKDRLHSKVSSQLKNLATDIDRGSFGGVHGIFTGLGNSFNMIFRAAKGKPDEHEYQNHVLASVLKFLSTPGLKQAAYDLQDDLMGLVQSNEVKNPVALHAA